MDEDQELQTLPNAFQPQMITIPHSSPVIRLDSRTNGKHLRFQVPDLSGSSMTSDAGLTSSQRVSKISDNSQRSARTVRSSMLGVLNDLSEKIRSSLRLPPLQRPLRPHLSFESYLNHLDFSGRIINFRKYKHDVFTRGFDPRVRIDVWRTILGTFPIDATIYSRDQRVADMSEGYYRLKVELLLLTQSNKLPNNLMNVFQTIRGDVSRTDRNVPFYDPNTADGHSRSMQLYELLCMYMFCHPSVEYRQGMADMGSVILYVQKDEAQAYICFCALMSRMAKKFNDSTIILDQLDHLQKLLSYFDPQLESLINAHKTELLFGPLYRWIMLELKREFDFEDSIRMLEMQWVMARHTNGKTGVALTEDNFLSKFSDADESLSHVQSWLMNQASVSGSNFEVDVRSKVESYYDSNTMGSWLSVWTSTAASESTIKTSGDDLEEVDHSSHKGGDSMAGPAPAEILQKSAQEDRHLKGKSSVLTQSYDERAFYNRSRVDQRKNTRSFRVGLLPHFSEIGAGNPFLIFLSMSMLMEYRDILLQSQNELLATFISVYGPNSRRHDTNSIISRAYHLLKLYLHEQKKLRVSISWLEELF